MTLATVHSDFAGRMLAIKSYPIAPEWGTFVTNPGANDGAADLDSGHGTHVTGSVLGDGSVSANGPALIRGHALQGALVFQAIEQEMKWKPDAPPQLRRARYVLAGIPSNMRPLFQFAYDQGARIHSNSWGGGDAGAYDSQCGQLDDFVWRHKDFASLVAAGNDGTDGDGEADQPDERHLAWHLEELHHRGRLREPAPRVQCRALRRLVARRLSGGALRLGPDGRRREAGGGLSSRGPTADGRIKPEVVAPGTFILSTRSSCSRRTTSPGAPTRPTSRPTSTWAAPAWPRR